MGRATDPAPFSELEEFVRTEVGLRQALQQQIAEYERELAALRGSAGVSADAAERSARIEAAEQELDARLAELQSREELVERARAELAPLGSRTPPMRRGSPSSPTTWRRARRR